MRKPKYVEETTAPVPIKESFADFEKCGIFEGEPVPWLRDCSYCTGPKGELGDPGLKGTSKRYSMMEVHNISEADQRMPIDDLQQNNSSSIPPERLDQIISDYCRVQESASNEIDRKRRAVRSKCEERLWMAALWRDYQLEIVKKTFENEIKQIEREHQSEFNNLKDSLMQELQEERKKLQFLEQTSSSNLSIDKMGNLVASSGSGSNASAASDSNGMNDAMTAALIAAEEQAAVASGRRLRRRDEKSEVASGLPSASGNGNGSTITSAPTTSSQSRRKQVNNIYTYSTTHTMLPEQEILDDLGAIAKEAGSLGTSRRAAAVIKNTNNNNNNNNNNNPNVPNNSNLNVTFDKGMLHYNWDIIGVSDRIKIQLSANSTAVNATVLACSATELVVSTGRNQIKISMADLKSGKVTIFTDDQLLHDN